jgi:hypothetical protein
MNAFLVASLLAACGGSSSTTPTTPPAPTQGAPTATNDIAPMWPLADPPRRVELAGLAFSVPTSWSESRQPPMLYTAQSFMPGGETLMLMVSHTTGPTTAADMARITRERLARESTTQVAEPRTFFANGQNVVELTTTSVAPDGEPGTYVRAAVAGRDGTIATCVPAQPDAQGARQTCTILLDSLRVGGGFAQRPNPGMRLLRGRAAALVLPADWVDVPSTEEGLVRASSPGAMPAFTVSLRMEMVTSTPEVYFDRVARELRGQGPLLDRRTAAASGASAIAFELGATGGGIGAEQRMRFVQAGPDVFAFTCGGSPRVMHAQPEICSAILDSIHTAR